MSSENDLTTEVVRLRSEAQALYNELFNVLMGESAYEACDELRARYPQYEACRSKEEGQNNDA